ncbi:MAG: ATP-binding protein [Candidatus Ancaeobacter aquaticus]|nr:ATP-binding protein [Candidatus Ancaeobacter aquaticus]
MSLFSLKNFGKSSVRRNPIIADLFHRMGKVERMGSGIERMRVLMREAGLKEPLFEIENFFQVIFYRDPRYSLKTVGSQKISQKTSQKTSQKILELMKNNPIITIAELAPVIGVSERTVKYQIANLKKSGLLKRVGPDKGGYWKIV